MEDSSSRTRFVARAEKKARGMNNGDLMVAIGRLEDLLSFAQEKRVREDAEKLVGTLRGIALERSFS